MSQLANGHPETTAEPNSGSSYTSIAGKKMKSESPEVDLKEQAFTAPIIIEENLDMPVQSGTSLLPGPVVSPPIKISLINKVYGRYSGQSLPYEIELRVDTDGPSAMNKVSGDYYSVSGQTKTYFGSFVVDAVSVTVVNGVITIKGTARTTWTTQYNKLQVTISQTTILQPLAPAVLQWFHQTTNAAGAIYACNYLGSSFRTVRLEQDSTSAVTPFVSYNTGSLTSGGSARVLSVNAAYREAGVDMVTAGVSNVVPVALAGTDAKWTNAELHNAMVNHFSLYQESPNWNVWLLHAYEHINGPGLYGIMFDQQGLQRQGAAVFYRGIGGTTTTQQRLQLFTCVHELGHCFNLLHSWQKSLATPPKPDIPNSLSWMNYPWGFPAGDVAFWNAFAFQFDPVELAHIRHGFRNDVIMGGNPFATGSSLENIGDIFEDTVENNANLQLELETKPSYLLGEPVVLETKLRSTTTKNKEVNSKLHANYGFVRIGIKKPGGVIVVFEPIAEMCVAPESNILNPDNPAAYESSYIGFDKHGFIFDQPGMYQIKAVYHHVDGSRIVSNVSSLRVKSPVTAEDDEAADLMLKEEVGYLLAFMGSDADYLRKGNEALDTLSQKHRNHPLAVYAQFVQGVNAQRTFKKITPEKSLEIRPANYTEGENRLNEVIQKSKEGKGLDNISLNQSMQILAKAYQRKGDTEKAEATVKDLVNTFEQKPIRPQVKATIRRQAAHILNPEK